MFIQVPLSLPKSFTLKLLNPSYLSCACFEAKPTPSICKVNPYSLASPDPKISPSGWVVMKRNLFLYSPSMHLSTYFRCSSPISVMFYFLLVISKFYLVMASILYLATGALLAADFSPFLLMDAFFWRLDLGMDLEFWALLFCLLPLVCFIFGALINYNPIQLYLLTLVYIFYERMMVNKTVQ